MSSQRAQAGELLIHPNQTEAELYEWVENMQDWCVSRQLWWGHQVPAYFVRVEGHAQDVRDSASFGDVPWPNKKIESR
jgi:valyl-tRNA synthetase